MGIGEGVKGKQKYGKTDAHMHGWTISVTPWGKLTIALTKDAPFTKLNKTKHNQQHDGRGNLADVVAYLLYNLDFNLILI